MTVSLLFHVYFRKNCCVFPKFHLLNQQVPWFVFVTRVGWEVTVLGEMMHIPVVLRGTVLKCLQWQSISVLLWSCYQVAHASIVPHSHKNNLPWDNEDHFSIHWIASRYYTRYTAWLFIDFIKLQGVFDY